jgi:hypothetical protein
MEGSGVVRSSSARSWVQLRCHIVGDTTWGREKVLEETNKARGNEGMLSHGILQQSAWLDLDQAPKNNRETWKRSVT